MFAATWIRASVVALGLCWPAWGHAAECGSVTFEALPFTVCKIDPDRDAVRLWLDDDTGQRIGTFARLEDHLKARDQHLLLAMNAGMYHPDRAPVGLYIEDGEERQRIVTNAGPGNFGMLPNGVLCLTDTAASIVESRTFANAPLACRHATQSGPMLVIDGALHPRFIPGSDFVNIRNGAGTTADGLLYLAISDEPVNFDTFARLFRDGLDTPNALYLDGRVSRLFARDIGRADGGFPVGPLIGVVAPGD